MSGIWSQCYYSNRIGAKLLGVDSIQDLFLTNLKKSFQKKNY
jgi:hypothetical protein